jgi:hypothetical protein
MRLLTTLLSAALAAVIAPQAEAGNEQLWTAATLTGKLPGAERWTWSANTELRFADGLPHPSTSKLRAGLAYRTGAGLSLGAGIMRSYRGGVFSDALENRLWQEANYTLLDLADASISGRTRVEQRMQAAGGETGWRLRQRIRYTQALPDPDYALAFTSETFWALNGTDWGQDAGFDQNRITTSLSWKITDTNSLEVGYTLIALDGEDELIDETRNIFQISLSLAL